MENEIKVNDFVRTKKHGIFKVETIRKTPYGHLCGTTDNERVPTFTIGKGGTAEIKNDIVKHSPNLIDIIEERRLCKWNISNRKRKHIVVDRNKRNR